MRTGPNDSQLVQIEDIGTIRLEHSRRARRIIIYIRPQKGVRVAVPMSTPFKQALEFVLLKKQWITTHLARLEQLENRQTAATPPTFIDKAEAKRKLIARLNYLAEKHGFKYSKVCIRNQRTRWGSCSSRGSMSLNMKLVLLPEKLMDYVILHELVHTRVPNHSRRFWAELDKYVVDSKAMAKKLRQNHLRLL